VALLLVLAAFAVHCSSAAQNVGPSAQGDGGHGDGSAHPDTGPGPAPNLPPPTNHRPTASACETTRPPGVEQDAGADGGFVGECDNDSQCTQGTNGRCLPPPGNAAGDYCSYDQCATDSDCGAGKVCQCGATTPPYGRLGNTCVPGDCRIDSDCGVGGFCSPTEATSCGSRSGVVGYYCHTPGDACNSDSDCTDAGMGVESVGGYCAWQPMVSHWECSYGICSG
jgi:hypothetical protein